MTYGELIYIVNDELRINSDDSLLNEDHILFVLNKNRAALLYQLFTQKGSSISENTYQVICLDLEESDAIDGTQCSGGTYLRSVQVIPQYLTITKPRIFPIDYFQGEITFVSKDRLKYVGNNTYLKNFIYCAIGTDGHLYFRSSNPQHKYLEKVKMIAVFQDPLSADELSCDKSDCNLMDKEYPLEASFIQGLVQSTVLELAQAIIKPADMENNAKDDHADLTREAINLGKKAYEDYRRSKGKNDN